MISGEECREVAARLRNQLTYMRANGEYYKNDLDLVKCGNSAYRNIADSVEKYSNDFTGYYIPIVERLADLIDRGECENVYDDMAYGSCDNGFLCSACGCKVEDEEHYHVSGTWNFCPGCGRVVVRQ